MLNITYEEFLKMYFKSNEWYRRKDVISELDKINFEHPCTGFKIPTTWEPIANRIKTKRYYDDCKIDYVLSGEKLISVKGSLLIKVLLDIDAGVGISEFKPYNTEKYYSIHDIANKLKLSSQIVRKIPIFDTLEYTKYGRMHLYDKSKIDAIFFGE